MAAGCQQILFPVAKVIKDRTNLQNMMPTQGLTPSDAIAIFSGMKFPALKPFLVITAAVLALQWTLVAQTNAPAAVTTDATPEVHQNTAIVPVPRTDHWATDRQALVLQRAKEAPGDYDIEFIGDSIMQGWEGGGKNVWQEFYGKRKVINFGVSGDRTQHVLWRFEQGQLDGIKAKVAVVMIGTNNSNNHDNTETEILEGVTAIVQQIRVRQPDTKILLLGIFPRGKTFSPQRGKILQVNEALARLDDGSHIFYLDLGPLLIENDGSIAKSIMPDALHPNEAGYRIWANATEPKLKQLLGE
jgi:beta-glucosidase